MKNKKGFTLVELLAVIALIVILSLLIIPNVIESFNNSKKMSFIDEAKIIFDESTNKFILEKTEGNKISIISNELENGTNLDLESAADLKYTVYLDKKGEIQTFKLYNKEYCIVGNGNFLDNYTTEDIIMLEDDKEGRCKIDESSLFVYEGNSGVLSRNWMKLVPVDTYFDASTSYGVDLADLDITIARREIKKIYFTSNMTAPEGVETYDLSEEQNGSIISWKQGDTLFIGCEKDIYLPSNSSTIFSFRQLSDDDILNHKNWFGAIEEIDFNGKINTKYVTDMRGMFKDCYELKTVDVSSFNTSRVTDMHDMFSGCFKLTSLDVSNFKTSRVTNMSSMFRGCASLTNLNLSKFNTSKVTNMSNMFQSCKKLELLDISSFDTSRVTNMNCMFETCLKLESIDVSHFNTSKVKNMANMFQSCRSLKSIDVNNWDTSRVTKMSRMFGSCEKLESIDVSNFKTSLVDNFYYFFGGCKNIKSLDLSKWNTSSAKDMGRMFDGCTNLESLDISHFNTSNVKSMYLMFGNCSNIETIDVSSFNTNKVENMSWMFGNIPKLKTIYVSLGFVTSKVVESANMFNGDTVLVGGSGTTYDVSFIRTEYARIDGGPGNPGYFTSK